MNTLTLASYAPVYLRRCPTGKRTTKCCHHSRIPGSAVPSRHVCTRVGLSPRCDIRLANLPVKSLSHCCRCPPHKADQDSRFLPTTSQCTIFFVSCTLGPMPTCVITVSQLWHSVTGRFWLHSVPCCCCGSRTPIGSKNWYMLAP